MTLITNPYHETRGSRGEEVVVVFPPMEEVEEEEVKLDMR